MANRIKKISNMLKVSWNSVFMDIMMPKRRILQILAQNMNNPDSGGAIFGIQGPIGNGKTTLVKEGLSKILNKPFSFIALGGASDGSFLEGHSFTYEGSVWGKIVNVLMESKCMNPVIYFDEQTK